MSRKLLTPEIERAICERYEQVERARILVDEFGVSDQTIYRVLEKHGIARTHRHEKPKQVYANCRRSKLCHALVVQLSQICGLSDNDVASVVGVASSTVSAVLLSRGIRRLKRKTRAADIDKDLLNAIEDEYVDGASCYELESRYDISRYVIGDLMRKRGIRRGRGSNSRKGGISCGQKLRERAKKRFDSVVHLVELLEYMNHEQSRVRCVKCGREFMWYKDHWKIDVPCPDCRAEIKRKTREKERKQKKYEREQQLEAAREWRLSVPRICECCGMPFYSEYETAIYCSPQCKRKAKVRRNNKRMRRNGCNSRNKYKRRMRIEITENTFDRTLTLDAVYKKYGGKCCSCGCKTVRSKNPEPNQATVDHVIALNNFGTHTWDNVQLLCRDCNSRKRDTGQMRLAV